MKPYNDIIAGLEQDERLLAVLNQRIDEFHAAIAKVRTEANNLATAKNLHWGHVGSLTHIVEVLEELAGSAEDSE